MDSQTDKTLTKWKAVSLALEMGFIIALPIVALGLLGKYLDVKFQTRALFKIIGLLSAIALSTFWLARRFSEIFKAMKSDSKD
ncbi:MAG: AtpZ/AtpI family protein [Patescibacteria group bacterium]